MPYASPLHILPPEEFAGNEATGDAFLLRLRKKLLAEYQLTNEPELIINGKAYTKDTIIKTIDVLLGNPDLPLHIYIFKNPALLDFLEGKAAQFDYESFIQAGPPGELLPAIHNLLEEQALSVFKRAMQSRDFTAAQLMIHLLKKIPGYQSDEYYHVIYNSLENIRGLVRSEKESDLRESPQKLAFLKSHAFSVLLNSLSEDFIDTINTLVADIVNFMVAYQRAPKVDRGFLYTLSTMLTKVSCDSELEALIKRNHSVYSSNYLGNPGGGSGGMSSGRVVYIILMVIVFGARILYTCDRNSSSNDHAILNSSFYSSSEIGIKEPTVEDKLKEIRKSCIYKELMGSVTSLYAGVDPWLLLRGSNPFTFLANADDSLRTGNSFIVPIKLVNHTGYDLVVIRHQDNYVHSEYVFKDSTLLYDYPKGYLLCFYAGTHWLRLAKPEVMQGSAFGIFKFNYENKFENSPPNAKQLFSTDYVINIPDKKSKKKKSPYTLELTDQFIETGQFKSKTLQLAEVTYTVAAQQEADTLR